MTPFGSSKHVSAAGLVVLGVSLAALALTYGPALWAPRVLTAGAALASDPNDPPDPNDPNDITGIAGYIGDWDPNDPNQDPNDPDTIPPIGGVCIYAFQDANVVGCASTWGLGTGLDGTYFVSRMDPGVYDLWVVASERAVAVISGIEVFQGLPTVQNIFELAPEAVVTGRVTDSSGSPVDGNDVSITIKEHALYPVSGPDPNGDYAITNVPSGTFTVYLFSLRYAFAETQREVNVPEGGYVTDVDFTAEPTGRVAGKVLEADGVTPIAEATISVAGASPGAGSDPNGDYALEGLAAGDGYVVLADLAPEEGGPGGTVGWTTEVSVADGQTTTVNIVAPGGSISGTVTGNVDGGVVEASGQVGPVGTITEHFFREAPIEPNGHYHLTRLPAGLYKVAAKATGAAASVKSDVQVVQGQETSGVDFSVVAGGSITGRVLNGDSVPLSFLGNSAMVTEGTGSGMGPPDPNFPPQFGLPDGTGNYKIEHLRPGTYWVSARADGYVQAGVVDIQVQEGVSAGPIDIVLGTTGGRIAGTVRTAEGQPIGEAAVACGGPALTRQIATTDAEGQYDLGLLTPGTYEVQAVAVGYSLAHLTGVLVTDDQTTSDQDIVMVPTAP